MEITTLREYIINEGHLQTILEELGCGNIVDHGSYFMCSNPDGDNPNAIQAFKDLGVIDYTRTLGSKTAFDVFDLVMFFEHFSHIAQIAVVMDINTLYCSVGEFYPNTSSC